MISASVQMDNLKLQLLESAQHVLPAVSDATPELAANPANKAASWTSTRNCALLIVLQEPMPSKMGLSDSADLASKAVELVQMEPHAIKVSVLMDFSLKTKYVQPAKLNAKLAQML